MLHDRLVSRGIVTNIYRVIGSGCVVLILGDPGGQLVGGGGGGGLNGREKNSGEEKSRTRGGAPRHLASRHSLGSSRNRLGGGSLRDEPKECLCRS